MNMVGKMARAGSGLVGKAARASSRSTATLLGRSGLATLVIAEHTHRALAPSTLSAITAASQLKDASGLDVLVLGSNSEGAASAAARVPGVTRVLHGDHPAFAHHIAENVSLAVARVAKEGGYTHIVAVSNMAGKNLVGRLAAELDTAPITDVVEVLSLDTFCRPMYAGNALATLQSSDDVKLLSVRPTAFDKAPEEGGNAPIEAAALPDQPDAGLAKFVSESAGGGERPDLTGARVVVSGGRGLKSGENFAMLEEMADVLGGAVGATRAAVDAGFVPNELQVGQTGKVIAPELYIAVGISGAIQHLSGMKDSKCIVAINKDKEAPIFSVADYGLVADLFEAVPQLTSKLRGL